MTVLLPTGMRFNRYQIHSNPLTSTVDNTLQQYLPASTIWTFTFGAMLRADYLYLRGLQGSKVLLQLLHPQLARWTNPVIVTTTISDTSPVPTGTLGAPLGRRPLGVNDVWQVPPSITLTATFTQRSLFDAAKYYAVFYG